MKQEPDTAKKASTSGAESGVRDLDVRRFLGENTFGDAESVAEWLAGGSGAEFSELEGILTEDEFQALLDHLQTCDEERA